MNKICVFCGSSSGKKEYYGEAAIELGELIAQNSWTLIYGGGNIGLMGKVADAVMSRKGNVIGVIPEFLLQLEVGHQKLTKLEVVDSMHTRKQRMAELADAFIALPGGFGTLEELAEITTWVQLKLVDKPIIILNINGFYDSLITQIKTMFEQGFISKNNSGIIKIASTPQEVIKLLKASKDDHKPSDLNKT